MGTRAPLVVDLYAGLGGWTEGFLAEGYRARGYDIEVHQYGEERYPGELVVRDVLQMHGSEVADADVIVGSSPCQEFSYRAMPWKRAKALGPPELGMALFHAQFRIQREANEARASMGLPPVPMVVENVRGAQKYVGRAAWNYGSYYLWGDVPALMPAVIKATKVPGFRFDGSGKSFQTASVEGTKVPALDGGRRTDPGKGAGAGAGAAWFDQNISSLPSGSSRRKAASAKIAKIPFALSSWIARTYKP